MHSPPANESAKILFCSEVNHSPLCSLLGIGDLVNARAVFERALAHEQCEKSQDLWEKYIQVWQLRLLLERIGMLSHSLHLLLFMAGSL